MDTTPTDSINFVFNESDASTSRIDNLSTPISELRIDIQLPQDLITEILVRLPAKSLLRFKCVSKPWLSLISNPQFIRSHFSKSDDLNLELFFPTKTGLEKCSLHSALHEADPSTHFSSIEFSPNRQLIVGIINGLVCLTLKGTGLYLWNPALNKIKHLSVYPEAPSGCRYHYNFGYEESNDDYKVVCLLRVNGNRHGEKVRIYSLKADSWRRIDELKGSCLLYPGVFANGKIYFISLTNPKIVSLDMLSEKFAELQHPDYDYDVGNDPPKSLGVSGGQLFLLTYAYTLKKVDLWVLDKRGVEESWCKLVSMPPYTPVNRNPRVFINNFLCISSNNQIVFGDEHGLLVYNWKKKESRNIKLNVGITNHWGIFTYVESLIWPDYA